MRTLSNLNWRDYLFLSLSCLSILTSVVLTAIKLACPHMMCTALDTHDYIFAAVLLLNICKLKEQVFAHFGTPQR